jgi:hypothetical protein
MTPCCGKRDSFRVFLEATIRIYRLHTDVTEKIFIRVHLSVCVCCAFYEFEFVEHGGMWSAA